MVATNALSEEKAEFLIVKSVGIYIYHSDLKDEYLVKQRTLRKRVLNLTVQNAILSVQTCDKYDI